MNIKNIIFVLITAVAAYSFYNHLNPSAGETYRKYFGNIAGYKTTYNGVPVTSSLHVNAVWQDIEIGRATKDEYGNWVTPWYVKRDGKVIPTYTKMYRDIGNWVEDTWGNTSYPQNFNGAWIAKVQEYEALGFNPITRTSVTQDLSTVVEGTWQYKMLKRCKGKDRSLAQQAARWGCTDCLKYLVEKGLDVNEMDCAGLSLAHHAMEENMFNVVEWLISLKEFDRDLLSFRKGYNQNGHAILDYLKKPAMDIGRVYSLKYMQTTLFDIGAMSSREVSSYVDCLKKPEDRRDVYSNTIGEAVRQYVSSDSKYYDEALQAEANIRVQHNSCLVVMRQLEYKCLTHKQRCNELSKIMVILRNEDYSIANSWAKDRELIDLHPEF